MTYDETKRMLLERDRTLRDAYYGRNGLSMSEAQRAAYRESLARAKDARTAMGRALRAARAKIEASGAPLLSLEELDNDAP